MNKILQGNSLDVLKSLPDESVNCVITSPPYWALRDYGTDGLIWDGDKNCNHEWLEHRKKPTGGKGSKNANVGANKNDSANMRDHDVVSNFCNKCGAWKGSFGLEPTFELYIKHLCDIFDEVKRVLKKDGTCWVNIGDTYNSLPAGNKKPSGFKQGRSVEADKQTVQIQKTTKQTLPEKCLLQIPSRFGIEMTNRGWILRNEIIWHKPNAMPSSVTDRFTVDFEKVFFFVKNKKYYFEQQKEPLVENSDMAYRKKIRVGRKYGVKRPYKDNQPLSHSRDADADATDKNKRTVWKIATKPFKDAHFATYPEDLVEPMVLAGCPRGGVILDPFFGSGTTGVVSLKNNCQYIGIELNDEYIKIAENRLKVVQPKLL